MSPGPIFDRVYLALKEQLTSGRFAPGDHLEPAALGEELNASITPVRDALHRLVGERIVETPRNDGFRVPVPTEAQLRDLYGWNREVLELALRRGASGGPATVGAAADADAAQAGPEKGAAHLFRTIVASSGNPEHEATIINLNERLAPIRAAEERLFADFPHELETLSDALACNDRRSLRRLITAYHRRRQRSVPALLIEWRRVAARV